MNTEKLLKILDELQEYIYQLSKTKRIVPIDQRYKSLGDKNKFWNYNTNSYLELPLTDYHVNSIEDIKNLISDIVNSLSEYITKPNHRISLYINDIKNNGNWFNVSIGSALLEDESCGWIYDNI